MNKIYKCLFVFMILLVSMGFACASDNITSDNETSILSVDDNAGAVLDDNLAVESNDISEDLLGSADESALGDSSEEPDYEIITSNVTKYDFRDDYKIKIVDESGKAVYGGKVDFYVNNNLVNTSTVSYSGFASFNLDSYISSSGTYNIVSMYTGIGDLGNALARQSIIVDNVPMNERDIQIQFENIKLYDLGEKYSVRVVDKQGNPVSKGHVIFVAYDRIAYCNISESGIASFYLPSNLNITGNMLLWTMYTDDELYDLAVYEQISIGTRTLVSLDKNSIGSRMFKNWNNYTFDYYNGTYVAEIEDNVYLVLALNGNCYLMYENTINTSAQLTSQFRSLASSTKYDVVELNLLKGTTYTLSEKIWEDQEWYYAGRVAYGQLIVNGNGATIKRSDEADSLLNFMYIGREANVNLVDVTLNNFNHVFINQGNLLCQRCTFKENHGYKIDVKLTGSGTVIHNYNTAVFDYCEFRDNTAEFLGFGVQDMPASILYAEPYSLNIFNGVYGHYDKDSFYGCNFSTTIIYDEDTDVIKNFLDLSEFDENSYFATVDRALYNVDNKTMVFDVQDKSDLFSVFKMLNTFITANNVVINLAPGTYEFSTNDYDNIRGYNFRHMKQEDSSGFNTVEERYLLDVGYSPVTINGNAATIKLSGNSERDDYHFAYVGKFGLLTLNNIKIEGFNTALFVTGRVFANGTLFTKNVIDHAVVAGDYGGAFRSHGGTVICHNCIFVDNVGDNVGDYSTDDFYADMGSYIELKSCNKPSGYMTGNSYLKGDTYSKQNVDGATYNEKAFESNFESVDFAFFNVSDDTSYNKLRDYLSNHTVTSLYINFTGDYNFNLHPVFDRKMAIVFNSNGHNVKLSRMTIESPSTMTFMGFNFNNIKIEIKGSATFINCNFYNNKNGDDYFFSNEGSTTLVNCSIYNNECDDYIISNTGSLTIYDGSFKNNIFDDDYGIIYNHGGTVSCINTTFSGNTEGYYIFNFESGNCAISGSGITSSDVEFDEAWANWKAGLVQGAFLLGTALVTYGAGAGIGMLVPGVAGLVVASVAGAGIGAVSGLTYGLIEGNVYHDYSNVWKHVLTYAFMGLGFAQTGFATQSNFIRQVDEAFNPGEAGEGAAPGQGAQAPQNPQNPQGPAGDLQSLMKNPEYQAHLQAAMEGDLNALDALGPRPQLSAQIRSAINSLTNHVNVNMQEFLALYTTMQSVLARQQVVPAEEAPINLIERVVNNQNNAAVQEEFPLAENIIDLNEDNRLVSNFVGENTHIQRVIHDNPNLDYLTHRLNLNTYRFADANQTHADRVLTLLSNFHVLYDRYRTLGLLRSTQYLEDTMRFYRLNVGVDGNYRVINSLFDYNSDRIRMYEMMYESALVEYTRVVNLPIMADFNLDGQVNLTTQIESRINNFIQQLDNRFKNDPDNLDKYETLKALYLITDHNDLDEMLRIYKEMSDMTKIPNINIGEYIDAISYDYPDLIRNNIYYSVFNRPNALKNINDVNRMRDDVEANLKLLREINVTVYNEVMSSIFNKPDFKQWSDAISDLKARNGDEAAIREIYNTYNQAYEYFDMYGYRKNSAINENAINIYYVKNLFKNYLNVYSGLSNNNKLFLNKYFYDKCTELMKTFNGLRYYIGLRDQSDNLNEVSNVSDTSVRYFEKLTQLYATLIASNGNDNLFNKNITGLPSAQIGDMIIEDLVAYYNINYISLLISGSFLGQQDPDFYLLGKIMNWAKSNSIDNLTSFYNGMSAIRAELQAVYTIEKQIYFLQPIDPDYYQNNIRTVIINRNWISTEIMDETSKLFNFTNVLGYSDYNKNFVTIWFVDNQDYTGIKDPEDYKMFLRTSIFINCFNLYLENSNIPKTKDTLIEMLLAEMSSKYPVNLVFDGEYSSLINLDLNMDLEDIKDVHRDLDPKEKRFGDIDVAELTQKLNLLKTASPVAYWMLMQKFEDRYDCSMISESIWNFDKKLGQFCTVDLNGQKVTYYDFVTSAVNAINEILPALGVIDGNSIRYKSMNYNIARLVDGNKYNNVFNKMAFYNQMQSTPENIQMMIRDMEYDLNILKSINDNEDVYDLIVSELFEGVEFKVWAEERDLHDLLVAYNGIFDALGEYRNNAKVLENEVNVLMNQLNNNTIKALNNNNLTTQLRANLLYFISFWEFLHKNTDESDLIADEYDTGYPMSHGLVNAPLQEIFNRYDEIVRTMIVHSVFNDKTDLSQLTLEEMQNLFNNNLYRAYHNPTRYAQVFEYLNTQSAEFVKIQGLNDFRAYENYINSIGNKDLLIEWYNAIRGKINPNGGAVRPNINPNINPNPVAGPIVTPEILNEIKKIILNQNFYDHDSQNIYKSKDEGYFMGSWKEFVKKYPELSDIVLKDLMKGNLQQFIASGKDFDSLRLEIVKFLENYKPGNNQPAKEKDSSIPNSQFENIKKIMEDCSIYPVDMHNVIGDAMLRLLGSWEQIEKNYPDIAKMVSESLFEGMELSVYAGKHGSFKNDYKTVREQIIEFIRTNILKENAVDIVVDEPAKIDILINGKPVSECSIEEINAYTLTRIRAVDISDASVMALLNKANSIYTGYIQYVDSMKSAGVPENEYAKGLDQFKNRYVDILKQLNSKNDNAEGKFTRVANILYDDSYQPDMIMTDTDLEYKRFLVVWAQLEKEFPDVAKHILQKYFQNSMDKLKEFYLSYNDYMYARGQLAGYAQLYLYVYADQNSKSTTSDMYIAKENIVGASREMVKGYMKNAVEKANGFVEGIRKGDSNLADTLKQKIDDLYAKYLVNVDTYSHEIQYILFIDDLNYLFSNLDSIKPAENDNPQVNKYYIQKENLKVLSPEKSLELLENTMNTVKSYVDDISKTNKKLAQWISDRASEIAIKYEGDILIKGDINSYNALVNDLNKLFKSSVGISSSNLENEILNSKSNDEIKNLIRMKLNSNPGLEYSEQLLSQIDQPNLNQQDLIAIYNTVNSYVDKELILKDKNKVLTTGNIFFGLKNKYYSDINRLRASLERNLQSVEKFFPDLYNSISLLFKDYLNRLPELSVNETAILYNSIKIRSIAYFMLFRNSKDFQAEIESRNMMENKSYDAQIRLLETKTFNFFDSTPIYFLRALDTSDAETIRNVIQDEMLYMSTHDPGLYSYCLNKYFNGASSPAAFFESVKDTISSNMADKYFQDLYNNIHNEFNSMRDLLNVIAKLKTDTEKKDAYIESFEKAHNVDISSDAAQFTRTLVIALMNLNTGSKYDLTNMLIQGLNEDGSLKEDVKDELLEKICQELYVHKSWIMTLNEADFEMLVDIMTLNFPQDFKIRVMADYFKFIFDEGGSTEFGAKDTARYNFILSLILKNKIMFDSENVILYPEELNLLNSLNILKCYKLMNEILQLKLKGEFSNKNTVVEGLIPGLNDILNSMEYKLVNNMEIDAGDQQHINSYYTVFNRNNSHSNLQELVELIDNELEKLSHFDSNLFHYIRNTYFASRSLADLQAEIAQEGYGFSYERLTEIYAELVTILDFWRNKDITEALEKL